MEISNETADGFGRSQISRRMMLGYDLKNMYDVQFQVLCSAVGQI